MNRKYPILILLLLISILPSWAQFRVIGYLPNWGSFVTNANSIDYSKITHLNIAFLNPDETGNLGPTIGLSTVVTKAHDNNVLILASLGGAGVPDNYTNLLQDANRPGFINKIVDFVNAYDLDGIDVDLEGETIDENYEKFVTDLKDTLSQLNKLTTAAIATWVSGSITNAALAQFDFVNLMSYDATGDWALDNPGPHSPYSMAENDLYHWGTTRGLAKEKITLGVPFYGYNFGGAGYPSSLTFNEIVTDFPGSENEDEVDVPGGGTIYYNGIPTIKSKTQLALSDAGGIMIWQLMQDATGANSLLTAINEVIESVDTNLPPVVSITSPANHSAFTDADTITITADATDSDGSIYKVAFYSGDTKIGEDFAEPYSFDWAGAGAGTYYLTARALDNFFVTTTSDDDTITVNNSLVQLPFGGTEWEIPGKIEAEDFDIGGSTFAYSDNNAINEGGYYRTTRVDIEPCSDAGGGYNVGWTAPGEWLEYSVNVTNTDEYDLKVRVATTLNGKYFHIELDGSNISGNIAVPNTGGWQNWQTITVPDLNLTAGSYIVRVVFDQGDFNLNYFDFIPSSITGLFNTASATSQIRFYPNPSKDQTTLEFDLNYSGKTVIGIYDLNGKEITQVFDGYLNKGNQSHPISLDGLEKGIYLCRILTESGSSVVKLMKE